MTTTMSKRCIGNQRGSAMVVVLLLLVLLTLLGVTSLSTSNMEIQIADNQRLYKKALFEADGGIEAGFELLEQNLACPTGFSSDNLVIGAGNVEVIDRDFWLQVDPPPNAFPSDSDRDVRIPNSDSGPHTNLLVFGNTEFSSGGALQMAAGYEGVGKGAAASGAYILYDIYSQHRGTANSEVIVTARWRHVIGQEGTCQY